MMVGRDFEHFALGAARVRNRSRFVTAVLIVVGCLAAGYVAYSNTCRATPRSWSSPSGGFYGSSASAPTGEKPQSKLWVADGQWWGSLFDPVSGDFHIHGLSRDLTTWTDTGVLVDERASAHVDALWDEQERKLYVVSAGLNEANDSHDPRVVRFSYSGGRWSRDDGFPVELANGGTESVTIAKDSTGVLWAAYTQGRQVYTQHTLGDDLTWSAPIKLPTAAASVTSDDIAAVLAYDGDKIGVLWSNERTEKMMFASRVDGSEDEDWTVEVAYEGARGADDHINVKSLVDDPTGRVLAAVKTSMNDPVNDPDAPLIHLLVLGHDGTWSSHVFSTAADNHTRAIVQVDDENRRVYMFAANPCCNGGQIYMKSAPLDDIDFPPGLGTPVISNPNHPKINNPTSTKQPVNSAIGLVVLAGDDSTRTYLHGTVDLPRSDP